MTTDASTRPGTALQPNAAVGLWQFPLDADAPQQAFLALLSAEEQARARRLLCPARAQRFVVAHGWLRLILAQATGQAPQALRLVRGRHGRPELADGLIQFSLSHSANGAAVVAAPFPIGIDLEWLRPARRGLAERFFSPSERAVLDPLDDAAWLPAFFRCWTRKEAVSKAMGLGLDLPLDQFSVTCLDGAPPGLNWMSRQTDAAATWQLLDLPARPGWIGAVAAPRRGWALQPMPLPPMPVTMVSSVSTDPTPLT